MHPSGNNFQIKLFLFSDKTLFFYLKHTKGEGNGNPLQYSCLGNPMNRGAWRAAVHRVTQSRTQLKRLSMCACIGEGNGNPLQYSCLENPRDRGTWWAAVYGVAQSRIRLKQLRSSSKHTKRRVLAISLKQMLNEYLKIQKARKTHYNVFLYSGFKQ